MSSLMLDSSSSVIERLVEDPPEREELPDRDELDRAVRDERDEELRAEDLPEMERVEKRASSVRHVRAGAAAMGTSGQGCTGLARPQKASRYRRPTRSTTSRKFVLESSLVSLQVTANRETGTATRWTPLQATWSFH